MLERGATLRAGRRPLPDLGKQVGPLAGLVGTVLLLAVLARTVGIGGAGWFVGLACGLALNLALARALWRDPSAGLSWASWVTLTRATLAVGVAALTAASFELPVATATLVALASIALALDFVDGWLARRTATQSALGAKLDGEVDAFLIGVLSIEVAPIAGGWVLLIGLARYLFLAAGWAFPWLRAPLPRRDWRKTVTAAQGIALVIAASGVPPLWVSRVLLARRARSARRVVRPRRLVAVAAPGRSARAPRCGTGPAPGHDRRAHGARRGGRVVHARLSDPAVATHPWCLRAPPARGTPRRRPRARAADARPAPRAVGGRAAARRAGSDQGLRPRLLHRVRPHLQPRRGLELSSRSASRRCATRSAAGTRILRSSPPLVVGLAALVVPALALGQVTRVTTRHRQTLASGGGRAPRRLGALLGVRRPGLRARGSRRRAPRTSRSARSRPFGPTSAARLSSEP